MNRFCPAPGPKLGSTATPSRPRSELEQIRLAGKVTAEVFVVPWRTISSPAWRATRSRPSGVKSNPVGPATVVTCSSVKLGGRAPNAAGAMERTQKATRTSGRASAEPARRAESVMGGASRTRSRDIETRAYPAQATSSEGAGEGERDEADRLGRKLGAGNGRIQPQADRDVAPRSSGLPQA